MKPIDYSKQDPAWLKLPRTRKEALRKKIKRFYYPSFKCMRGHNAPQMTGNNRCVACCQGDKIRIKNTPKVKSKSYFPVHGLHPECKPKRISYLLAMDDDVRKMNCQHYIGCGQSSLLGKIGPGKSWLCLPECKFNTK